ncbi:hypothetical protein [Sporosarcina sp. G11-34]|uniref:hypothetical protein n=1 Tax=Sporosarcina sp. G11-34 TaxID=2849605 RepID=UPI0022A932E9|nr:hypothetical protein [Sporosarcina sp. G11-34]MCZ2260624.1 hypothetical protein [Sporosarcina sp. G11-34]
MVNAFRVILLVIISISFIGIVGEKIKLYKKMLVTFLGGLAAFIVSVLRSNQSLGLLDENWRGFHVELGR